LLFAIVQAKKAFMIETKKNFLLADFTQEKDKTHKTYQTDLSLT
jgi:hypothetical protein